MNGKPREMTAMQKIDLPENVRKIISVLETAGYEAYAVGGCVRDSVLRTVPKDWDITTSALPGRVKALFPRCIDTGTKHGTVTVMIGKTGYEVTTFRVDGSYSDGRHPDSVAFTDRLSEDLLRRDFTINAMAYSERTGIVDLFGGMEDLKEGIIRAVGVPRERFSEDALRIMRLARFSAQLGFRAEENTLRAAKELSGNLRLVSAERIREEFMKTLRSDHPEKILLLQEIGAMPVFFPELSAALPGDHGGPAEERIRALGEGTADPILRLSVLFDIVRQAQGLSPDRMVKLSDARLRALKFDNHSREQVLYLMRFSEEPLPSDPPALRLLLSRTGKADFPLLLSFRQMNPDEEGKTDFKAVFEAFQGILGRGECTSVAELSVSGNDLIAQGQKPGKSLGLILKNLLSLVLSDPSLNTKETLLQIAEEMQRDFGKSQKADQES